MFQVIEGFRLRKDRVVLNKRYRWYVPKALKGKISKGDLVLVRSDINGRKHHHPVLVVDVLEDDEKKYSNVVKIIKKNKAEEEQKNKAESAIKNSTKRKGKFSDEDKEAMKKYRSEGKTLKAIAEIYSCSISTVHKIIKS